MIGDLTCEILSSVGMRVLKGITLLVVFSARVWGVFSISQSNA